MSSGTLEGLIATYRSDPEFIAEGFAIEVLEQAVAIMREHDVSRADLARRLGVSRAAVSQMFGRSAHNLTILTMARLASALGTELRIGLGEPVQGPALAPSADWASAVPSAFAMGNNDETATPTAIAAAA
jgi:transcriptional regulator with XRE-family HTH domain